MDERERNLIESMGSYVDGDMAGFEAVYRTLYGVVRGNLRRWAGDDLAEDLAQQTFMKLHQNRERYQIGAPVSPWVLTIARNLATDALRRRGRQRVRLTAEGELPEPGVMSTETPRDEQQATIDAVRAAVGALPDGQREVVQLHKLEERSFDEVAGSLGIRTGAARVRAHRAYARLRELLSPTRRPATDAPAPQPLG